MERLKRHGINCLQPKRIMISGKIRVFCFDKTGTLTKEGLDFVGFQPPVSSPVFFFERKQATRKTAAFSPRDAENSRREFWAPIDSIRF